MTTSKVFRMMAFKPENGLASSTQSAGWGDTTAFRTPGASDAFPFLELGSKPEIITAQNNSITGKGFAPNTRIVGRLGDQPFVFHPQYNNADFWFFWTMGFANNAIQVVVFTASNTPWSGAAPVAGTLYKQGVNEYFYSRKVAVKDENGDIIYHYFFKGTVQPTASGVLTALTGGGTFTYTDCSRVKYERLYELDSKSKFYRDFTTAEKLVLDEYSTNDLKVCMATICQKFENTDMRFGNAVCRQFNFGVSGADLIKMDTNFLCWDNEKGDFNSDEWGIDSVLVDGIDIPALYQGVVQIGTTVSNWITACPESINVMVEFPRQKKQTICSGKHLASPEIAGFPKISFSAKLAFYDTTQYESWRDSEDKLAVSIRFNSGYDSIEYMLKNVVLSDAGPDGSAEVVSEDISGEAANGVDVFASGKWLEGHNQLQDSPLLLRVVNDCYTSPMFTGYQNFISKFSYTDGYYAGIDSIHNLYVSGTGLIGVVKMDMYGNYIQTINLPAAGQVKGISILDDVLFVASSDDYIYVYELNGTLIDSFGGTGSGDGQFNHPIKVAKHSNGNFYVTDYDNDRVQIFDSTFTFVDEFGVTGSGDGELSKPYGIYIDSNDDVYVVDSGNDRVQKFDENGVFISKFGTTGTGDGQFTNPVSVVVESDGTVLVADQVNNNIQKFNSSHVFVSKIGSNGSGDLEFSDGPYTLLRVKAGEYMTSDINNSKFVRFNF